MGKPWREPLGSEPRSREVTLQTLPGPAGQRQQADVAAALGELPAWIAVLELARQALERAASSIVPSPAEEDPEVDLDRLDLPTEVRSVLAVVAEDFLRPAIDDLQALLPGA
jgi:hypothetical protein